MDTPRSHAPLAAGSLAHATYTIQRPFWSVLGRTFRVLAPDGSLVLFVRHPWFKLRQQLTLFTDESQQVPVVVVRARQIIGFDIAHDVFDAPTGQRVGSVRSRGLRSLVRDTWDVLDADDRPVGQMQEDGAAMLRRVFPMLLGTWHVEIGGETVAHVRQLFRLFVREYVLDLSASRGRLDARFAIACALLAVMVESRREAS